ncbi:TetR/AcrR family transcriptional regulator [Streptomyces sp. IBSBF 2953]|uniref:ScbR family autoregulator-binding transcription factor n=1 Tax=Streptomyces TaxID=1883 RepID=UPI00211A52E9|nr:ScbR family autoregulator-binding transcription factor [Streptomyces scabiei]MCQ9182186.1 TetR/AcrR family transcriptional regulator [Streptomyces hayashii]MDX3117319.1 ScbR family autoregulator-binding transcription factor [Streptomyces scabiei]
MARQSRAIRTREALEQSAAEVFAREGFVRASLPLISQAAGVSRGALHFHFGSKDDLARAIEKEAGARMERVLARVQENQGRAALQLVVDATHGLMEGVANDAVVRAGFRLDADVARESSVDLWGRWRAWVRAMLVRAERSGELAAGVSGSAAGSVVLAVMVGFEALAARDEVWGSPERLDRFWGLMLPLLAAQPHRARAVSRAGASGAGDAPGVSEVHELREGADGQKPSA